MAKTSMGKAEKSDTTKPAGEARAKKRVKTPAQSAAQPGQTVKVTIKRLINRAAARKTIERLFLKDRTHSDPLDARSKNFIPLPKRRGGQIWTKRPNKIHIALDAGAAASITATPQVLRDLNSVANFVDVKGA